MVFKSSRLVQTGLIVSLLLAISCSNESTHQKELITSLELELSQVKDSLSQCQNELGRIKNTPEIRLLKAQNYETELDNATALLEYNDIIEKFPQSKESIEAKNASDRIQRVMEGDRIAAEKRKALKFNGLKKKTKITYEGLSIGVEKIWIGSRWIFDSYGDRYFLRDAERGNTHILARISITSKYKNPTLPPLLVYKLYNGQLVLIDKLKYEFRRWKDYGSYLGNYADYGNDFNHSETIRFSLGLQLEKDIIDNNPIYVVLKKEGCFYRDNNSYSRPEVSYKPANCDNKTLLDVDDFEDDYVLVKTF